MLKNKIFKYLFFEFFKVFFLILFSLSILIWITQASRLLELITEYGNSIDVYLKFMLLNFPKVTEKLIMLSFLISFFFLISKLEEEKELTLFWISGIDEMKIIKLSLIIASIVFIINLILSTYLSPLSSLKARKILANSKFSIINSLVKEKNFNTPLKGLTIYVDSNDKRGNLKGVFIYEQNRTIIAEKGEVITDGSNSYLKLINGETFETSEKNIKKIKFSSSIYDFNKFRTKNIDTPKFSERGTFWIIKNIKNKTFLNRDSELREELNKRIIKPMFLFVLCLLGSLCLYNNKKDPSKFKYFKIKIYILAFVLLVINEIILGQSGRGNFETYIYFLSIIFLITFEYLLIIKIFKEKYK